MMVLSILCVLISLLFAQEKKDQLNPKYFTLLQTYGDNENLPKEYLIALPSGFAVDNSNNVYVFDEQRIKIYKSDGSPKAIIGGPGQGPGEFTNRSGSNLMVGPNGYISAIKNSVSYSNYFNVYDSNFKYVKDIFIEYGKFNVFRYPEFIIVINKDEYIYHYYEEQLKGEQIFLYCSLEYVKNKISKSLASHNIFLGVSTEYLYACFPLIGQFCWNVSNEGKVFYTYSGQDEIHKDKNNLYIIHSYDISTGTIRDFQFSYTPRAFPEENKDPISLGVLRSAMGQNIGANNNQYRKPLDELYNKYLKKLNKDYYHAIRNIVFDNLIAYVVTETVNEKTMVTRDFINPTTKKKYIIKEYPELLVDIIDLKKGIRLNSLFLPREFESCIIKNGYLYNTGENDEGYYCIKKYKINPSIYLEIK